MTIKKPSIINVATVGPMSESRRMPQVEQSECAETRFASMPLDAAEHVDAGIWECSPGVFRREVTRREFSHFLEGYCTFVPDEGEPIELCAGDATYWPADCRGTWHVHARLRKTYVLFD